MHTQNKLTIFTIISGAHRFRNPCRLSRSRPRAFRDHGHGLVAVEALAPAARRPANDPRARVVSFRQVNLTRLFFVAARILKRKKIQLGGAVAELYEEPHFS